jgi:pimeloyl-ACP methyl ester carboxylesterase
MKRIALALVALVAGCGGARLDGFLYAPVKTDDYKLPDGVWEVSFPSTDGVKLYAAYVPGPKPVTLVYCHGQGGDITDSWPRIELLEPLGWSLFIWDYRGFGKSTGTPSERGIHDDEEALWTTFSSMVAGQTLVYYGRSFGGAPCIDLATRHPPSVLVEESTFTSVDALVHDGAYVDLPRSYVADDSWNSLAKIATLGSVAFLALHGAADDYVQPKYSEQLAAAHPGTTQLVLVPGATHENVPDKMGFDDYRATLDAFVSASAPTP